MSSQDFLEKLKLKKELEKLKEERRRLEKIRLELVLLSQDLAKRLNLPEDKNPRALLRLLRKYRGLSKYMAGDSREPIHFGELYDFCKEIISKWTLNDVDDLIKTMCHYMQLNRKEAVAKIVADLAFEYILLYEFFQGIPNHFEKFYDETRSPACVTKLAVLYGIENGNQSDK